MKHHRMGRWALCVMGLAILACVSPQVALFQPTPSPTPTPGFSPDLLTPEATLAITPVATLPRAEQQPTATAAMTATPDFAYLTGDIRLYPGPLHYVGDLISMELVVGNGAQLKNEVDATISIDRQSPPIQAKGYLYDSPLTTNVLVLRWVWDTSNLDSGMHQVMVTLPDTGGQEPQKLSTYVNLLPASARPPQEVGAKWDVRNTACCTLRFVTHTPAERDVYSLADRANKAVAAVEQKMGFPVAKKPVPLTFIGVEWGNGAYTGDEVVLSYVDRAYVANDFDTVLRHEITHWAMRPYGGHEPLLLAEGVAVYIAGGHYKPEPMPERGRALVDMDLYIPLTTLTDQFSAQQHETAYIEAGSFVQYLVETYGWGKFLSLYGSDHLDGSGSRWLDEALRLQYQKGLSDVERDYKAWLMKHDAGTQLNDVRLGIALYNLIRRYQDQYAPYQEALPASQDAVDRKQTAEFMRQANAPENIALEMVFETAGKQLRAGQYAQLEMTLAAVDAALSSGDFSQQPVADSLAIAKALAAAGYEGQSVDISGDSATAQAIHTWPRLQTVALKRSGDSWTVVAAGAVAPH